MNLEDTFRCIVGAYYGVCEMDNYSLKEYVLKDIEKYVKDFITDNPIPNFNYLEEARKVENELSIKSKLQDCLIILPKVHATTELILLVKAKIKEIREEEINNY